MRNPEMTKIRDRKMVETFYLLYDKKRIRLEDVLLRMSHDLFFLDQNYIYKRIFYISENLSYYEQLKEGKKPDSKKDDISQLSLSFLQGDCGFFFSLCSIPPRVWFPRTGTQFH